MSTDHNDSAMTVEQEQRRDELAVALSQIARPSKGSIEAPAYPYTHRPINDPFEERTPGRRSRFFYRATESTADTVASLERERAQSAEALAKDEIVQAIDKRADEYGTQISKMVIKKFSDVREFFLKELNPLWMAAQAGTHHAKSVAERALNAQVDPGPYTMFENMVEAAIQIKISQFVTNYTGLQPDRAEALLSSVRPRKEVYFFPGADERRANAQTVTPKEKKPQPRVANDD